MDRVVGNLTNLLVARGMWDSSLVAFFSDKHAQRPTPNAQPQITTFAPTQPSP
jgi:hypothetical protein